MNRDRRMRISWRAGVAATTLVAATVAGGGYALASGSSPSRAAAKVDNDSIRYIIGSIAGVHAHSQGSAAAKCPKGMYPIGGGPSSSRAVWLVQWSDPDRSSKSAAHPNEWTVGEFNTSGSTADLKVYVVCSTATSVSGNF